MFGIGIGVTNQPVGLDVGIPTGGGSNIKSMQRGFGQIAANVVINNIPISAVDLTKAVVMIWQSAPTNLGPAYTLVRAKLTSETNLEISRELTSTTASGSFNWQVVEFNNAKSLQKGDYQFTGNGTVTISAVDLNKTLLFVSATSTSDGTGTNAMEAPFFLLKQELISSTQFTLTRSSTNKSHWQVVEFN